MTEELFIWIERWPDFQTYQTKRGRPWAPPWIKLYPSLLDEPRFLDLTAETRMLLVGLLMLFARTRGTISKDTRRLARQLNQRVTERQLETLNDAGWITFCSGTVREQKWNAFWNGSTLEVEVEEKEPVPAPTPEANYADSDIDWDEPNANGAGTGSGNLERIDPTTILKQLGHA